MRRGPGAGSICTAPPAPRHTLHGAPRTPLQYVARHFEGTAWVMKQVLGAANLAHIVLGATFLEKTTDLLNRYSGRLIPTWNKYMPKESAAVDYTPELPPFPFADHGIPRKVVYLPTCVTRIMGPARGDDQQGARGFGRERGRTGAGGWVRVAGAASGRARRQVGGRGRAQLA